MTTPKDPYYSTKLLEVISNFEGTKYQPLIEEASKAYLKEEYKKLNLIFEKFPNEYLLLEKLVEKLKGKSVYKNLQLILKEDKTINEVDKEIALSSLYTHICIEVKQGNLEYSMLKNITLQKLNNIAKK